MKILEFLTILLASSITTIHSTSYNCGYENRDFSLWGDYKTTNFTGYTCSLKSIKETQTDVIEGQHKAGKTDNDIKYLTIHNNLKKFPSILCQKFKNLEMIFAQNFEIGLIVETSVNSCRNLQRIYLDGNKIREFPKNLLPKTSKIVHFRSIRNELSTLPENFFAGQNQLEQVEVERNKVSSLPAKIFQPLENLQFLTLLGNKLQVLNPEWFANLKNLKLLILQDNQILELPTGIFKSLTKLEKLWLGRNKIKTLRTDCFAGLQNVKFLSLFSNEIAELPVNVFGPLKNLQELFLYSNKLTTIHSDSFGSHRSLKNIHLKDNKINLIDRNFIDKTAVSYLDMTNNLCSSEVIKVQIEIKGKLKKCFDNYRVRTVTRSQQPKPAKAQTSSCGKSMAIKGNIIGGNHITRGSFPWIAALVTNKDEYFCGGTLASSQKVITAAHCLQPKGASQQLLARLFKVLLGSHDLKIQNEVGRFPYAVQSVHLHPDWNPYTQQYDADIAVLVLDEPVLFNNRIQPICLISPTASSIKSIKKGVSVGYGKSVDLSKLHENIPKVIDTPIHNNEDCFLKNSDLARASSKRTFCGGSGTGTGVCNGDSGSGLFVLYNGAYYLRGIISSSLFTAERNCDVENYSIFTDVVKFNDWVNGIEIY